MRCGACEHENRDRARFCEACGTALVLACVECHQELRAGARFCDGCGTPVGGPASVAAPRDPRVYTPKHLADRILASKSALEGERKQVSVLFADVQRSMELAEEIDLEEWHRIMDRFFAVLAEGVHRFEGTINQFTGDGIMALFGAPLAHEDHAQRACFTALHLTEELRSWADELRMERGLNLSVRMGLNSGEVVVGKIGDDLRMDYTAQGMTVGLAARMEQIAAPGTVYLTEHTAELVSGYFKLRDLGESRLKGVAAPVHVYELEGTGSLRTRLDLSRSRGFFEFVGRKLEMATLEGALARAAEGAGQVVGIVGEAGVGKSRLCAEFVEKARARGLQVLEAHCPSYGRTIPFLPVLELLRSYFGITEEDPDPIARQKIAGTLLLLNPTFAELLPIVFDFLSVPDPERPSPQMSPEARQRQLQSFVRRLVQDESSSQPSVILVDDLHWIDPGSDAFLAELASAARETNTLLVANFRPEYSADWMQQSHYQQIPLAPLAQGEIDELLGSLLGDDPSVAELPTLIRERTGGNPFFIEEVVNSLLQSGGLVGTKGTYRLESPVTELEIPATVQALLAARIDRLGERDKQVLQTAAVIGKRFRERVLKEVIQLPDPDLASALSSLRQAELLYEEALYPEVIYAFRHPLTHEVAYGSQLSERRREKHAAAARAIEDLYADRLDEQAALIAHHREQAGELVEAARWHARAAQWSGNSDPLEAVRHWQSAYDLLNPLPEGDDAASLRLLACVQIFGVGGWRLGMSEETEAALYRDGRSLAERLDNQPMLAMLLAAFATRRANLGDAAGMLELALEAAELAKGLDDREVDGVVTLTLVYSAFCSGRLREGGEYIEQGIERFGDDLSVGMTQVGFSISIFLQVFRCSFLAMTGQLEEAGRRRKDALALAREHSPENLIWALTGAVFEAQYAGDGSAGEAAALEALELAEKHGSSFNIAVALTVLALVRYAMGRWDEALALVDRQIQMARASRTGLETEAADLSLKAEILLGAGQPERAEETAREAVAIAEERETLGWAIMARIALARILLERHGGEARREIETLLERTSKGIEETGMRVQTVAVVELRARLAAVLGNPDACREGLAETLRLAREFGASGHVRRLEAELEE